MIIEKDGQIIVTELRPMGDLEHYSAPVLLKPKVSNSFVAGWRVRKGVFVQGETIPANFFEGFINFPIYQPEQKQEPVYRECGG